MNILIKQKQTHRHREQTCGCQGAGGKGGENWDQQMQTIIYTLDEQQGIWYRMGNYIQYLVINHNRKEYEDRIHICITESLGCIAEIKHNIEV